MQEFIFANEPAIRLSFFLGMLLIMAGWEFVAPRRPQAIPRRVRWPNNLGIVVVNTVVVRLLFPMAAVGLAVLADERGWGLFNVVSVHPAVALIASVVLLDLAIYLQHVMFHAVPALWRLHRLHHADLEFDVTTGLRFHPVEIVLSMLIKFAVVVTLGPPALAVLIFEVLLNAGAMFNHGNVRLPLGLDRLMRWLIVTPDMHRVHHSVLVGETNSNFGFNLSCWDRALGTYRDQPEAGHDGMTIGIDQFREPGELRLDRMLTQPARGSGTGYAINQRDKNR
ncbi:MAG: sterol desaturase family protein [Rhodospirillaceae bacterium]|nr:sterol desaturase family protein [Rhodospirillaceae bacterium]